MWPSEREMTAMYWTMGILCALAGWCVIEGAIWIVRFLMRHLHWIS